jgi:hypothetical protein
MSIDIETLKLDLTPVKQDEFMPPRVEYSGGWRCAVYDPPEAEEAVLACVAGFDYPIVLERRWETCNEMIESYFKEFLYWECPHDEGFDGNVYAWRELPELPTIIEELTE